MQRYIVRRLGQALIALFMVSMVVFALGRVGGDPLDFMMPPEATPEDFARVRAALGLDEPIAVQYVIYMGNVLRGDLGKSMRTRLPVSGLIAERLPYSVNLSLVSLVFSVLIAVPVGVVAAIRRGTRTDAAIKVIALLGQSMPAFWLGLVLMLIFAVWLDWLPAAGAEGPTSYILPAISMSGLTTAGMMRLIRSSMLDVLDTEYIKLARIKGVSERRVIWVHALRNSFTAAMSFAAIYFVMLIGTAVVTETVFWWPGMGRLVYEAALWRDLPIIQGVILTITGVVIAVNLAVDLLYAYVDPRIRY